MDESPADLRSAMRPDGSALRAISAAANPIDRSGILTEQRNPRTRDFDRLSILECVQRINEEDATVPGVVAEAAEAIAAFIETALKQARNGGRLIYLGAGTSGRLGALDAAECPPTFHSPPDFVVGLIAGGDEALRRSSESREDEWDGARAELETLRVGASDAVLGVAAGGTTPYTLGGLAIAKARGAATGLLVCAPTEQPEFVDHLILLATGPEVIAGSTRMKAGTATKLALHTISTTLMTHLGKAHENLMVDICATSAKLRDRAARIIMELTGAMRAEALALLDRADGRVKTAVVMRLRGLSRDAAERLLEERDGRLRDALEAPANRKEPQP